MADANQAGRNAFSSAKFGFDEAKSDLKSTKAVYRDELVARSMFHYDRLIRERTGVRYLGLRSGAVSGFESSLVEGFQPDLKTYASMCETPEDAARLADVCCRVRFCVGSRAPQVLSKSFWAGQPESVQAAGASELARGRAAWLDASAEVLQESLNDVYFELGRRSPGLLGKFVEGLDKRTWDLLYAGVQGRTGPDATQESLARSDAFLNKHRVAGRNMPSVKRFEASRYYFYDWSFMDKGYYAGMSRIVDACGGSDAWHRIWGNVDKRFARSGEERCRRHERFNDHVFSSMMLRESFDKSSGKIPDDVKSRVDAYYHDEAVRFVQGLCARGDVNPTGIVSDLSGVSGLDIEDVFRACPDSSEKLRDWIPSLSELCNDVYARRGEFAAGAVSVDNDLTANLRNESDLKMGSCIVSHVLWMYDDIGAGDPDAADVFIKSLSDDLYAGVCGRRPLISEVSPRDSVQAEPVQSEVLDEDGLASNRVLNSARTKQLLNSKAHRELLSQCMYRYEYAALVKDSELNAFVFDGFGGKAPNETFRHIAANCESPDEARMLARIVNMACQARNPESPMALDHVVDSLVRDDLRFVLCEPGAFQSKTLRDAFSEGLSSVAVFRMGVADFAGDDVHLSANPAVCSDDDIFFAKQQGFSSGKWFSKESSGSLVRGAVDAATCSVDDQVDVFRDVGALATACCGGYAAAFSGVQLDDDNRLAGLKSVIAAGNNADDLRNSARVCSLVFGAASEGRSSPLFAELDEAGLNVMRQQMQSDVLAGYNALPDVQKPKFVSGLSPSVRDDVLRLIPGAWSNGSYLEGVPEELAPAAGYANRLNAFGCPDFSKQAERVRQPVFIQYQGSPERGTEIRDMIRTASGQEGVSSVDAQYALSVSCLATYQEYGMMAAAEAEGGHYVSHGKKPTYSFYELAEQCNAASSPTAYNNIAVLSKAFRGVIDNLPDTDSPYSAGMRYAAKTDMARAVKFLESAGMKRQFMNLNPSDSKYGRFLSEAVEDMPVYVNSDVQKSMGRSRPKGLRDIQETMSTADAVRMYLENTGRHDDVARLDSFLASRKPVKQTGVGRNMQDVDSACADIAASAQASMTGSLDNPE